ncbi:yjeF-like protein, hydroxyethylthiazole kinase-related protein [Desulfosporosinus acidiphilus SJ4]|uniref:Bifunctional NAD(P)H-hydrate repair enzyme n=1 Tax=Desulfosporosinus acidiphilus (strain DSM 22704 / JCM 16185 / SJ4) TaxID=646529 RepID=I4D1X3_DESAJ|nr:bifunctional ADP-dependent NAD(P)H-hydrate dehydratase/NAD(P)H-hydrate epimerase [Desulfosporosinus acidiphilus]AFM39797.1 yjeF-like protein, hydroxyethylthiazole kinase-related protein [Desulfosporosinus acidiphilus SJ4]
MRVVNVEQMRKIEERAIRDYGIPSLLLMENAAWAVVEEVRRCLAPNEGNLSGLRAVILAGKGNNGGDGLAAARHLVLLGMDVSVLLFAKAEELKGDAALNCRLFQGTSGKLFAIEGEKQRLIARYALAQADVIIDALYGIGMRGTLPSLIEDYVNEVNNASACVIAVDIPSGVEADTGNVYRTAIRAQTTVTFGLPKWGLFLGEGPAYCGRVSVDPISIPKAFLEDPGISTYVLTDDRIREMLPVRELKGHKGTHGKGVLIAGSKGMSGAAVLAGRGALRSGIGLLQIVTPLGIAQDVDAGLTEATVWAAPGVDYLNEESWPVILKQAEKAQAIAIGPGLAQNFEFAVVLEEVLRTMNCPIILDADALNLLSEDPSLFEARNGRGPLLLTPHPGEMARLCQCTVFDVERNRLDLALTKAAEWEAVVVLKGSVTIVASPDGRAFFNPTGNPGLGTGGTGDVLTGSILAWLAQGVSPLEAACLGVYLHGKSADDLAKNHGWSGFLASEVADQLPKVRHSLELKMS